MSNKERNLKNECWTCSHRRSVPYNSHIACINPDLQMEGNAHGIKNGWFFYPFNFDPVWKEKECANYENQKKNDNK